MVEKVEVNTACHAVIAAPSLPLADVYSSIGYPLRHTAAVEVYLQQHRKERGTMRQQNEAHFGPHGFENGCWHAVSVVGSSHTLAGR